VTGLIAACVKWVDRRPEIDPVTGAVHTDARTSGLSAADESALEWALRAGEAWGAPVHVVSAGPAGADGILRDALARGAATATRVELGDAPSETVALALADALAAEAGGRHGPLALVCCGDHSLDRGSGAVPAYLAGHLGAAQALGLLELEVTTPGTVTAMRRLDGGRRERIRATGPVVVSVEGGTAPLRRASLSSTLAARSAAITVVAGPVLPAHEHRPLRPFRPRPRLLAPPAGTEALERVRALTAATGATGGRATPVELGPDDAADRILAALVEWGERDGA
jgi:electron transfer flavoprotein beta subunit